MKNLAAIASSAHVNDATAVMPVEPPPQAVARVMVVPETGAVVVVFAAATVSLFVEHVLAADAYSAVFEDVTDAPVESDGNTPLVGAEPV